MASPSINSPLLLKLDTGNDLTTASSVAIRYKLPNGTRGQWTGAVTETTKVSATIPKDTLTSAGYLTAQSVATIAGETFYGDQVKIQFIKGKI